MSIIGAPIVAPSGPLPLAAAVETGGLIFFSGQLALENGKIIAGGVRAQTAAIFSAVEALLGEAGLTLDHICKATVWLTRVADFAAFNEVWVERFKSPYPARSTTFVQLLVPEALVEIEFVASREVRFR